MKIRAYGSMFAIIFYVAFPQKRVFQSLLHDESHCSTWLASWKHHVNLLLQSFRSVSSEPVMANLFMEEFEKKVFATSTLKPGFWLRYVDDTLSSWAHGLENLHRFLEHINSLHPSIKFTLEMQKEDNC